ncbi:MAG: protein phosphatase 2C domain-containing protein, partial [Chloroflexi bacterium]|nr:protein phosphatase 2C domain-containing protein [Chloroflexota bacterium]
MATKRAGASPQLTLGSMTHQGRVRRSNEDACAALLPPNAPAGASGLLIVADGMGGHQAGGYASNTAVNAVVSRLRASPAAAFTPTRAAETLRSAVEVANVEVHARSGSIDRTGMGTTLTTAVVSGPILAFAHVGDSRAYLLRNGELARLTSDHTWVADRVRTGELSQEQAATHSKRNVLTRAIGV